jgi:hypothetical protein
MITDSLFVALIALLIVVLLKIANRLSDHNF